MSMGPGVRDVERSDYGEARGYYLDVTMMVDVAVGGVSAAAADPVAVYLTHATGPHRRGVRVRQGRQWIPLTLTATTFQG